MSFRLCRFLAKIRQPQCQIVDMYGSATKLAFVSLFTSELFGSNFLIHLTQYTHNVLYTAICLHQFALTFYCNVIRLLADI